MVYEMYHKVSLFFFNFELEREGFQSRTACSDELWVVEEAAVNAGQIELVERNDIWPFEQDMKLSYRTLYCNENAEQDCDGIIRGCFIERVGAIRRIPFVQTKRSAIY
ncbi:hypothetical protein ABZX51_007763 [Aspergillus tubingensis]